MGLITTMMESVATISRPKTGRDSAQGTTIPSFTVMATNLPCSYQEPSSNVESIYSQRNTVVSHNVYFAQDPNTEVNDVIDIFCPRTGESFRILVEGEAQAVARGRVYLVTGKRIRPPK